MTLTLKYEVRKTNPSKRVINAYVGQSEIWAGVLSWGEYTHKVALVLVNEEWQHRKIATAMWRWAQQIDPEIHHAEPVNLNSESRGWIKSLETQAA